MSVPAVNYLTINFDKNIQRVSSNIDTYNNESEIVGITPTEDATISIESTESADANALLTPVTPINDGNDILLEPGNPTSDQWNTDNLTLTTMTNDSGEYNFTVMLNDGYALDTVELANSEQEGTLMKQTDNTFTIRAGSGGVGGTIALTSKLAEPTYIFKHRYLDNYHVIGEGAFKFRHYSINVPEAPADDSLHYYTLTIHLDEFKNDFDPELIQTYDLLYINDKSISEYEQPGQFDPTSKILTIENIDSRNPITVKMYSLSDQENIFANIGTSRYTADIGKIPLKEGGEVTYINDVNTDHVEIFITSYLDLTAPIITDESLNSLSSQFSDLQINLYDNPSDMNEPGLFNLIGYIDTNRPIFPLDTVFGDSYQSARDYVGVPGDIVSSNFKLKYFFCMSVTGYDESFGDIAMQLTVDDPDIVHWIKVLCFWDSKSYPDYPDPNGLTYELTPVGDSQNYLLDMTLTPEEMVKIRDNKTAVLLLAYKD